MVGVTQNGQVQTDTPIKPITLLTKEIRFYYIDFEYARRFENEEEANNLVFCEGGMLVDLSPELEVLGVHIAEIPHDPFKLDIWLLGLTIGVSFTVSLMTAAGINVFSSYSDDTRLSVKYMGACCILSYLANLRQPTRTTNRACCLRCFPGFSEPASHIV